ncbi:hypothetical protein AA0488_2654 [Kozakia baliensis NRIC 0488]|nr:hypothetical protein AA0488_2654 [Kozakia baliensis NRIC 0488]
MLKKRQGPIDGEIHTTNIDPERFVEILFRGVVKNLRRDHSRVCDKDVDPPFFLPDFFKQVVEIFDSLNVTLYGYCIVSD